MFILARFLALLVFSYFLFVYIIYIYIYIYIYLYTYRAVIKAGTFYPNCNVFFAALDYIFYLYLNCLTVIAQHYLFR